MLYFEKRFDKKFRIIDDYEKIISYIASALLREEKDTKDNLDADIIKKFSKKDYTDELRKIFTEMITDYYSTESYDKLKEYRDVLNARLEGEYKLTEFPVARRSEPAWGAAICAPLCNPSEKVAKNWATILVADHIDKVLRVEEIIEKREELEQEQRSVKSENKRGILLYE